MKKSLYSLIGITFLLLVLSACNKKLDVKPQNDITPDQLKTSDDVENLLFGGYSQLQSYSAFGEQYMLIADLLAHSSQVDWVGSYTEYTQVANKSIQTSSSVASSLWGNSYKIIGIANTVLDKLNLVDSADRSSVEGEAKFMRALSYFELVGLFAKPYSDGAAATQLGVPIVLAPVYSYNPAKDKPARNTVQEVYTQILNDLKDAVAKLPASNDNFRADLYSAKAILARVYMSMGNYSDAAIQADDVIESKKFSLTTLYNLAFNNPINSSEDIFAIQQTNQSNAGTVNQGLITFYAPNAGQPKGLIAGRGEAQVDPGYFTIFDDPNDFRGNYFTDGYSITGRPGTYPNKWSVFYRVIPVVRLAEMYLIRGEANLHNGTNVSLATPDDDINTVRGRSGAAPFNGAVLQDFVDERFRELGFEGDRMWTLKRLKMSVDGHGYDDDLLILPIPRSEIVVNPNLIQNNGY